MSNQETVLADKTNPKVYPNPFSNKFTFEFHSTENARLEVLVNNALGQLVYRKSVQVVPGTQSVEISYEELGQSGNVFIYNIVNEGQPVKSGMILHR